ncbi:MAG: hypothetical protein EGS36_02180 [Akkermansia muciniphila]|nr:hypothetical protein [Akkermansia muciniphila]
MVGVRFSFPVNREKKPAALLFPDNSGTAGKQEAALSGGRSAPGRDRLEKQCFGMLSFSRKL